MFRSSVGYVSGLLAEMKTATLIVVAFVLLTVAGVLYGQPGSHMFEDNFWHRDDYGPRNSKITSSEVKLPKGMRGRLLLDPKNHRLSMDVSNLLGDPIPGLEVSARIARPDGKLMLKALRPGPDGRYHADKVDLPVGTWNVTLTGHDSRKASRDSLTFRVEKQLKVE